MMRTLNPFINIVATDLSSRNTGPDIEYDVHLYSHLSVYNPRKPHANVIKYTYKHSLGTRDKGIFLKPTGDL